MNWIICVYLREYNAIIHKYYTLYTPLALRTINTTKFLKHEKFLNGANETWNRSFELTSIFYHSK